MLSLLQEHCPNDPLLGRGGKTKERGKKSTIRGHMLLKSDYKLT